jgi:hypothetical protein
VIATEPRADLLDAFDRHGGGGKPRVGQLPVCCAPDRGHRDSIHCGDDPDSLVEAVCPYAETGFTEIAPVQIGGETRLPYPDRAERTLLPALREALG